MKKKNLIILILFLLLVATSMLAYYFYSKLSNVKSDPNIAAKEQFDAIIGKVGKLIELPEGETPTMMTIADLSKLKDQPFFKRAKIGDKVILYNKAAKALLYDPSADKLIDVAPINTAPTTDSASDTPPPAPAPALKEATSTKGTKSK